MAVAPAEVASTCPRAAIWLAVAVPRRPESAPVPLVARQRAVVRLGRKSRGKL